MHPESGIQCSSTLLKSDKLFNQFHHPPIVSGLFKKFQDEQCNTIDPLHSC